MGVDVPQDGHGVLEIRVVAGQDAVIRPGAGGLGQFPAAHLGAAAHRTEHADQAFGMVGPQRFEGAGQGQAVVGVVHQEDAPRQALHHLEPAPHRGVGQGPGGLSGRDAERPAQGDGAQRVGGAERPRRQHPYGGAFPAVLADEIHPQGGGAAEGGQPAGVVVRRTAHAETDLLPAEGRAHVSAGLVVGVVDHHPGVVAGEQAALGVLVILKIRVFAGADVIFRQVGESHGLKGHAVHPVMGQRLAAHLQHGVMHPRVHHFAEQAVQFQAFGRGVGGGLVLPGDVHAVGTDVGAGQARFVQDGGGQQRRGGLALGAGDADEVQFPGGVAVKIRPDDGQRRPGVPGDDLGGVGGQVQRVLGQKGTAALVVGAAGEGVAVHPGPHQADEQRPRPRLAGIVGDGADLGVRSAGVFNAAYQIVQFHGRIQPFG